MQRIRLLVGTSRSRDHSHWFVHSGTESAQLEVVAHARNGAEVIQKAAELRPEAVLVDADISGLDVLGLTGPLGLPGSDARAVLFCLHMPTEAEASSRVLATACTYVLDRAKLNDVAQVIQVVHASSCVHTSEVARLSRIDAAPIDTVLTMREREILAFVVREMTSREIGARLGISPRTVDAHRASVMKKLGIHTMVGLVRYALEHGVLDPAAKH